MGHDGWRTDRIRRQQSLKITKNRTCLTVRYGRNNMTFLTLSITLIFVAIPLLLSKTLRLGLEKDTIIANVRSIIQLLDVGYLLEFVLDAETFIYIFFLVTLMFYEVSLISCNIGKDKI